MRRFAMSLMIFSVGGLLAMPLSAQESKDDAKRDKARAERETPAEEDSEDGEEREEQIKALTKQLHDLHKRLAELGVEGPDLKAPRLPRLPNPEDIRRELQERTRVGQLGERLGAGALPPLPGGQHPAAGGAAMLQHGADPHRMMMQQMSHMLEFGEAGGLGGEHDPLEMGRRMVITGLEVQLRGVAERIRATDDEEAKAELNEELEEMVERIVEAREKHRQKSIERLEKRLESLKEEEIESAETMLKRLRRGDSEEADEPSADE